MASELLQMLVRSTAVSGMWGLAFFAAEGIWPARAGQPRLRAQLGLDVFYLYGGVILGWLVDLAWIGALVGLADGTAFGHVLTRARAGIGSIPMPLALALAVVVADFTGYWKHRLFHTKLLWPFHAVHHSSENVDWLSNERLHPVESVLTSLIMMAPLILLGFRPETIAWAAFLRRTHSIYEHANIGIPYGPLGYVFVSPTFHRWHHASDADVVDKNYANVFSLWDVLFGTYHVPPRPAPEAYGIASFPRGPVGQFVVPFRELAGMVKNRLASARAPSRGSAQR
jgi:sterol desaturase/sphingolipid hydroxylase (fatty acid hydroxylase superfamily)